MVDILIKNAIVVTVNENREIHFDGALAIKGDEIVAVGPSEEVLKDYPEGKKVFDAEGKVVFPGFINTHTHLFQSLLKGMGDDMALSEWLGEMMFPAAIHLTEEDAYYGAMSGLIEGIRSGVTTTVDYMHTHNRPGLTDGIVKAYKEIGARGYIGRGCMNTGTQYGSKAELMEDVETVEKDLRRLFEAYHNTENGRIKICVAPSSMWSNTRDMHQMLWDIVQEYDSIFAAHISETPFARIATEEVNGKVDAELLEDMGIVGPNVLAVHCVYVTDEEIEMMKKHDIQVSHNVASNMFLSSGVAPVPKMLKAGLNISLGLDGAASNNSQDMIELMKLTALQQKVANLDPLALTAEKVLEMATIDGARALGMEDEVGSLEVGKKADMLIFNPLLNPKAIPLHNPVSSLVYSSSMENVESVIIDGNIVLEDNVFVAVEDEIEVLEKIQEISEKLCERGNMTNRMEGHEWNSLY